MSYASMAPFMGRMPELLNKHLPANFHRNGFTGIFLYPVRCCIPKLSQINLPMVFIPIARNAAISLNCKFESKNIISSEWRAAHSLYSFKGIAKLEAWVTPSCSHTSDLAMNFGKASLSLVGL